jgi:hypothetical protein
VNVSATPITYITYNFTNILSTKSFDIQSNQSVTTPCGGLVSVPWSVNIAPNTWKLVNISVDLLNFITNTGQFIVNSTFPLALNMSANANIEFTTTPIIFGLAHPSMAPRKAPTQADIGVIAGAVIGSNLEQFY